jgi:hypothetical protein
LIAENPIDEGQFSRQGEIRMTVDTTARNLANPVFHSYALAASLMILKLMLQPFWTYVVSLAAHFVAYVTAQLHDVRAFCWTWGSLSVIVMAVYALAKAL